MILGLWYRQAKNIIEVKLGNYDTDYYRKYNHGKH